MRQDDRETNADLNRDTETDEAIASLFRSTPLSADARRRRAILEAIDAERPQVDYQSKRSEKRPSKLVYKWLPFAASIAVAVIVTYAATKHSHQGPEEIAKALDPKQIDFSTLVALESQIAGIQLDLPQQEKGLEDFALTFALLSHEI